MRPTKRAGNGVLWCRSIAPLLLGIGLVRAPSATRPAARNGANNDSGIVQPPTGGPIFLAIYVAAPDASPEARDNLVAETARISIAALTRPVGAAK
ncbi:MAG TPA: hypothetical protein VJK31_13400 [Chthoniobacterales bacterium]|jgi:hypothetical protein|nr:hypothetical protein [Chthoniobacterales bacterium]